MDRLQLITIFVAVAEEEGFAAGARRLKMSPPAVTRAIAALEEHLGVQLLTRTTRIVRVTEAGKRYLEDGRRIIAEIDEADAAAAGINAVPRGLLAVTAPALFGRLYVTPGIIEFLQQHPETTVSTLFIDRVVNLIDEGMDVGLRIGALPDSSLHAIRVGQVRRVVCATPGYLGLHGTPQTPEDLQQHTTIAATAVTSGADWKFSQHGKSSTVRLQPRLQINTNDGAIAAALGGFGLTRVLSYQIAPYLESGQLQTVLDDAEDDPLPVHVIFREGRRASAKVRTFVDLMVARLRADKALS